MQQFYRCVYLIYLILIGVIFGQDFFCNFETDLCGFTHDNSNTDNWIRIYYETGQYAYYWIRQQLPSVDHTYGNATGYYMYAGGSNRGGLRIISPYQAPDPTKNNTVCLQFWYHMYGNVGDLNVYVRLNSSVFGNRLWSLSANRGNIWRAIQIDIQENITYQVVFEGTRPSSGYNEGIAIDDVMIRNSPCQSTNEYVSTNVSCTFETMNLCGYRQDESDDFDWLSHNGATTTRGTGPSHDHTLGTELGFYMYIDTSEYPIIEGHRARIISPVWNITQPEQCVEFWYHMYGSDTGALSLYIKPVDGSLPADPVVRIVGHKGDVWLHSSYLMNDTGKFELVFEAIRGPGYYGDISLDDVRVYSAPCANNTEVTTVTVPLPFHKADCDFESENICNYTQDTDDDFDWTLAVGSTSSSYTGPDADHTYGNQLGHYMFIETSYPRSLDQKARLLTPILTNKNKDTCFSMYSHMYGHNVDFLKVYKKDVGGGLPIDPIFVLHGNQGNIWRYNKVDVAGQTESFQIVFEGTSGSGYYGDIAVDDLQFHNTSCDKVNRFPEFEFIKTCDFEGNETQFLCGFKQSTTDDFDWEIRNGSTDSTETGPSADHTFGNAKGHYLYIEASSPRRPYDQAGILSPVIRATDHLLCFRFWYHMKGEHVWALKLYRGYQNLRARELLWLMGHDQGDRWIEAVLPINYNANYDGFIEMDIQMIFEGIIGKGHLGDIAIDDISMEPHHCFPSGSTNNTAAIAFACDFESGITECGFKQDLSDMFDWRLLNISDESQHTPNYSMAIERQGNFIYLNMTGRNKGDTANIASMTIIANSTQRCLAFKYFLQGDVQQQINVYSFQDLDVIELIGTVPYKNTSRWMQVKFDLPVKQGDFNVMFEGVVGFEPIGIIALDDVTVKVGACTDDNVATSKLPPVVPSSNKQEDEGNDIVAKLFISFTMVLILGILLCVGIIATHRKYVKKRMKENTHKKHFHYSNDPSVSNDAAVDNPAYEITSLGNA